MSITYQNEIPQSFNLTPYSLHLAFVEIQKHPDFSDVIWHVIRAGIVTIRGTALTLPYYVYDVSNNPPRWFDKIMHAHKARIFYSPLIYPLSSKPLSNDWSDESPAIWVEIDEQGITRVGETLKSPKDALLDHFGRVTSPLPIG